MKASWSQTTLRVTRERRGDKMKYFLYALLLIALIMPQLAGAQEPPKPPDTDGDGIPDSSDPDSINVPAQRELPTDYPIFTPPTVEQATPSNIRLVVFRSPNPD